MKHTFEADDGTLFETAAECKRYEEKRNLAKILSELVPSHVTEALNRTDIPLADAIERAGSIIAAKRRESGDLKRAKKQDAGGAFQDVEKAMAETVK
jgi:hypothetical protein